MGGILRCCRCTGGGDNRVSSVVAWASAWVAGRGVKRMGDALRDGKDMRSRSISLFRAACLAVGFLVLQTDMD
jgi:hypothetical protein